VLHGEQHLARIEIDDVLEERYSWSVNLHGEEPELFQPPMGGRRNGDVDLYVVAVIRLLRRVGLAELPVLFLAHLHAGLADVRARGTRVASAPPSPRR